MAESMVYILRCNNGRYYIGSTPDLDRRIAQHQEGKVAATRYVRPVSLAFSQEFPSLTVARKTEYALKAKKSRAIIEQIIADGHIAFVRA